MKVYEIRTTLVETAREAESVISPSQVHQLLLARGFPVVEEFTVLFLNGKHRVVATEVISRGTLNAALVHPREVFGPALRLGTCAAIILAHNHPSGDPEPSAEDLQLTRRMVDIGQLVGIEVVDHLVYAQDEFVSFRERGYLTK